MMKIKTDILCACMIILGAQADGIAIDYSGNIRLGAQYHDGQTSGSDIALGAAIHAISEPIDGLGFGLSFYTTNAIFEKNDAVGVPFFGDKAEAYSILSKAYMQWSYEKSSVILGRQILDTPFLDSDDIGMIPNSFEAYSFLNQSLEDTTLVYSFVRQMSGVDSDAPQTFLSINGDSGVHLLGLSYEGMAAVSLSGWAYVMPHFANITYAEVEYEGIFKGYSFRLLGQSALEDFKVGESAKVFGFSSSLKHEETALSLYVAYDKSLDAGAINGFGGGPYFVNCEHLTLEDVGRDGSIFVYGLEWDASSLIADGMSLTLTQARLEDGQKHKGDEVDIVLSYAMRESLTFDAIYSTLDNSKIGGDKFDNLRVFANYSF
jgi:hypothetical protein